MRKDVLFYEDVPIDIKLIQETFEAAFKIPFSEGNWKWRFKENPNNQELKIAYIIINGKLASYYAVNPVNIFIKGNSNRSALSLMTMTHPDFTGQGLFKIMASSLFSKMKDEGYNSIYGFANTNSHYGFRKYLGWHDLRPMYILQAGKVKSHISGFQIFHGNVESKVLSFLSKLKVTSSKIYLAREYDFLKYRVLSNPNYLYKYCYQIDANDNCTAILFKRYKNEIDLMEVFFSNENEYLDSFKSLIFYIHKTYDKKINIWSNLYNKEHLELEKVGFRPIGFNSYFGLVPLTDEPLLTNFKNWHIRFLDSDIF